MGNTQTDGYRLYVLGEFCLQCLLSCRNRCIQIENQNTMVLDKSVVSDCQTVLPVFVVNLYLFRPQLDFRFQYLSSLRYYPANG